MDNQHEHLATQKVVPFIKPDRIRLCTRELAIGDSDLIDVSEVARMVGFGYSVAMTRAAWFECVAWAGQDNKQLDQDEMDRLWEVLCIAKWFVRHGQPGKYFQVCLLSSHGPRFRPRLVNLKLAFGPETPGKPVINILLFTET